LYLLNKLKFIVEKEKFLLCFIIAILGVTLTFNAFIEIINMSIKINFYIYINSLFLFNQNICFLLFGIFLTLLGTFSINTLKTSKKRKILELVYCTIGITIFIISLLAFPKIIENDFYTHLYLPIFVSFFFIGFLITIYNIYLLYSKNRIYNLM